MVRSNDPAKERHSPTSLMKDGTQTGSGGVTFDHKLLAEIWQLQNWCRWEGFLESFKCIGSGPCPVKNFFPKQLCQRFGYGSEPLDEPPIVARET